jgi:hypothetical protein
MDSRERWFVVHDETDLDAFKPNQPITFDESVFDGVFDGPETCCPTDSSLGCIFHVFIPSKIMTALAAKHAGVIDHRTGKIDDCMALPTFEEGTG